MSDLRRLIAKMDRIDEAPAQRGLDIPPLEGGIGSLGGAGGFGSRSSGIGSGISTAKPRITRMPGETPAQAVARAQQALPQGVQPSTAGAGRGTVNPEPAGSWPPKPGGPDVWKNQGIDTRRNAEIDRRMAEPVGPNGTFKPPAEKSSISIPKPLPGTPGSVTKQKWKLPVPPIGFGKDEKVGGGGGSGGGGTAGQNAPASTTTQSTTPSQPGADQDKTDTGGKTGVETPTVSFKPGEKIPDNYPFVVTGSDGKTYGGGDTMPGLPTTKPTSVPAKLPDIPRGRPTMANDPRLNKPVPVQQTVPEPAPTVKPEPVQQPAPAVKPEPVKPPAPVQQPTPAPTPQPSVVKPEPTPQPAPTPVVKPEPKPPTGGQGGGSSTGTGTGPTGGQGTGQGGSTGTGVGTGQGSGTGSGTGPGIGGGTGGGKSIYDFLKGERYVKETAAARAFKQFEDFIKKAK